MTIEEMIGQADHEHILPDGEIVYCYGVCEHQAGVDAVSPDDVYVRMTHQSADAFIVGGGA